MNPTEIVFNEILSHPHIRPLRLRNTRYLIDVIPEHPFVWYPLKLPACQPDIPQPVSDGYWYRGQWNSLVCRKEVRSVRKYRECLCNTSVYFLGDILQQQRAVALLGALNVTHNETTADFHELITNASSIETVYNISVIFQSHPFTSDKKFRNTIQSGSNYEAEVINSLSYNKTKTILVISPSYHFQFWQIQAYHEYLEYLRQAVVSFRERMPFGKIVLVSPQFPSGDNKLLPIFLRMHDLQRTVFEKSGVYFMDVYDLEQGVTWDKNQNVSPHVLKEEIHLFLSLVCE